MALLYHALYLEIVKRLNIQPFASLEMDVVIVIFLYIGPQIVAPELKVTEWYERSGVVVTVEWTRENSVSYNVSTFPEFSLTFIGDTSVKMVVPYNTQFMMNISAMLCESHMTTTKNFFCGELERDK